MDILDVLDEIKIGYAYEINGKELLSPPGKKVYTLYSSIVDTDVSVVTSYTLTFVTQVPRDQDVKCLYAIQLTLFFSFFFNSKRRSTCNGKFKC